MHHRRQLTYLPPAEVDRLMSYQSDPDADSRLVLFPIAILRARAVSLLSEGLDVTRFINDILQHVHIFGPTLDTDAWELPAPFWDKYDQLVPGGRQYCGSLETWRRRDGHTGSSILELILGLESPLSRRDDPVGKPPGWSL